MISKCIDITSYNKLHRVGIVDRHVVSNSIQVNDITCITSIKGCICTVYVYTIDDIYYGEYSTIYKVCMNKHTSRQVVYKSTNYIYDIQVDYAGRLCIAEGFGVVRVIQSRKKVLTLEETVDVGKYF